MDQPQGSPKAHAAKNPNQYRGKNRPKKTVSFQKCVDVILVGEAWQMKVQKGTLNTEEDQAKRRMLQRNY